jgi:hypothetical protein
LYLVFVDAFWWLSSAPISAVKQSESASAFGVFLVVEAVDIFEVSIEVEEEFYEAQSAFKCIPRDITLLSSFKIVLIELHTLVTRLGHFGAPFVSEGVLFELD